MKLDDNENFLNNSSEEFGGGDGEGSGMCPEVENILPILFTPKPFGLFWKKEKMVRFLKNRGWKVAERFDDDEKVYYQVAYKAGDRNLPEEDNIIDTFEEEVQDSIIELLTNGNKK